MTARLSSANELRHLYFPEFKCDISESQSLVDIHGHIKSALIPSKHMIHHVTHGNDQEIFQLNCLVSKQLFFAFHTLYQAQAKRDR